MQHEVSKKHTVNEGLSSTSTVSRIAASLQQFLDKAPTQLYPHLYREKQPVSAEALNSANAFFSSIALESLESIPEHSYAQ
jgi:hypothetical protein